MADRIPLGDKKRCPPGYKRDPTDHKMCIKNPSSRSKASSSRAQTQNSSSSSSSSSSKSQKSSSSHSKSKQTSKRTLKKRVVKKTSKPKFKIFKVNQKVSVTVKGRTLGDQNSKFIAGKKFIEKEEGNVYNGFIMSETEARNTMNINSWNPIDPNCQRVVDANRIVSDIQVEYQNETDIWPGLGKIEDQGNSRLWYLGQNVTGKQKFRGGEVDFDQPLVQVDFEPLPPDTYYVCYNLKPTPEGKGEDLFWRRYGVFHASDIGDYISIQQPVRRSIRIRNR